MALLATFPFLLVAIFRPGSSVDTTQTLEMDPGIAALPMDESEKKEWVDTPVAKEDCPVNDSEYLAAAQQSLEEEAVPKDEGESLRRKQLATRREEKEKQEAAREKAAEEKASKPKAKPKAKGRPRQTESKPAPKREPKKRQAAAAAEEGAPKRQRKNSRTPPDSSGAVVDRVLVEELKEVMKEWDGKTYDRDEETIHTKNLGCYWLYFF